MVQLAKECKKIMVKEVAQKLGASSGLFLTDATGLPNKEMEDLRRKLKTAKADYLVVKNSICRLALHELKLNQFDSLLVGTTGIGIFSDDPVSSSKVLVNFSREHKTLKIKGAILDGTLLTPETINELAALPSREVILARVLGGMKAPITNFVNLLQANIRNLVNVLNGLSKKKEENK